MASAVLSSITTTEETLKVEDADILTFQKIPTDSRILDSFYTVSCCMDHPICL